MAKKTATKRLSTKYLGKLALEEQPGVASCCELAVEMHCKVLLQPRWA
jgi:hypothetical protein